MNAKNSLPSLGRTSASSPQRGKGRPRNFDREQALAQALDVFWRRGYAPASISELCQAMGINAPSLYAAFGNKTQLFLEAVRFYEATYWDAPSRRLQAQPDVHKAVGDFFCEAARILLAPHSPCGCMVVLAAVNIAEDEHEVITAIGELRLATRQMFVERLERARVEGQLPAETDVAALAGALNTLLEGLSLQARDGLTLDELERVAALAVRLLPRV